MIFGSDQIKGVFNSGFFKPDDFGNIRVMVG
jgi:hypothetical protein